MNKIISFLVFLAISVNCMASSNIEKQLTQIKNLLLKDTYGSERCSEISQIVGYELPLELCNLLHSTKQLESIKTDENLGYFWNSNLLAYDELLGHYREKNTEYTFFSDWNVDDKFNINGVHGGGETFSVEFDLNGELDSTIDIVNAKSYIPVFYFEGNYILYCVGKNERFKGLLSVSNEGFATMAAPSLSEHIDDLLDGIKLGRYFYNENGLMYPHNWFHRMSLKAGKIKMDEYGEIIEPGSVKEEGKDDIKYPGFLEKWLDQWKDKK